MLLNLEKYINLYNTKYCKILEGKKEFRELIDSHPEWIISFDESYTIAGPFSPRQEYMDNLFVTGKTLVDCIYDNSVKYSLDFRTLLGIATLESGMGIARLYAINGSINIIDVFSYWKAVKTIVPHSDAKLRINKINSKYESGIDITNDELVQYEKDCDVFLYEDSTIHDYTGECVLIDILDTYKKGEYNPGLKDYIPWVEKCADNVFYHPCIQMNYDISAINNKTK